MISFRPAARDTLDIDREILDYDWWGYPLLTTAFRVLQRTYGMLKKNEKPAEHILFAADFHPASPPLMPIFSCCLVTSRDSGNGPGLRRTWPN
jgi:hypothetical protein